MAPTPTEPSQSIWITPKTRARISLDRALHEREGRYVDERVTDAEQREQDERGRERLPDAERDQRNAPEDDAQHERRAQASSSREREREHTAYERTNPYGRVEITHASFTEVEQLDRRDDEVHLRRSGDERLGGEESPEDTQRRLSCDRSETDERLRDDRRCLELAPLLGLGRANPEHEQGRHGNEARRECKDRSRARHCEQQACECGPNEGGEALDRARHGVCRGELRRRSRE